MTARLILRSFPVGPSRKEGAKPLVTLEIRRLGLPILMTSDDWETQVETWYRSSIRDTQELAEEVVDLLSRPDDGAFDARAYSGWHVPFILEVDWDFARKFCKGIEYESLCRVSAVRCRDYIAGFTLRGFEQSLEQAQPLLDRKAREYFQHQGNMDHAGHPTPHLRGSFKHWNQHSEVLWHDTPV